MALVFGSLNSTYVNVGSDVRLDDLEQFTFGAWVYCTTRTSLRVLLGKGTPTQFRLNGTTGNVQLLRARSTDTNYVTNSTPLELNSWVFLCAIFDSTSTSAIYAGSLSKPAVECTYGTSVAGEGALSSDAASFLAIGNRVGASVAFQGHISHAALWKRVLLRGEIITYQFAPWRTTARPIGLWNLGKHHGTGIQLDISGFGNHGSVSGATSTTLGLPIVDRSRRRIGYVPAAAVENNALTATGIATGAPTLGTPAITQIHALSGISISTGAPALGTPAITQVHVLTATAIATGAPTLGTPAITQVHALTATGIVTGAPTLGTPVAAETHSLTATGIATGAPTLGTPAITQVHALTATEIATGAPTLGTPLAAETHALTATGIATGAPTLGTPAITQVHALTATGIATGAPSLALPAISQVHVLVAMIMVIGAASVGNPYLVQGLMVAPSTRTFTVPQETRSNSVAASNRTRTA